MRAMQLTGIETTPTTMTPKEHAGSHPSTISESFGQAWQRETGTAKSGTTEQLPKALDPMPRIAARENRTQLGLAQRVGAEAKKSEVEPAAAKTGSETAEKKDAPSDLPKVAERDEQRVDENPPQSAALSRAGKIAKSREKHDAAAAKPVGAAEGEGTKAEARPGVASTVVVNLPECGAAIMPPATVPAGAAVELVSPALRSASRAVALEKAQAGGSRVKQSAAPAVERDRPAMVEAKHETAQSRVAINAGSSVSHTNSEVSHSASNAVLLRAAEGTTVAVPISTSTHPAAVSGRAEARLDATKAAEVRGGNAPQVLESGPARLDVGVFDDTHGWLRIRAELGTGGTVNTSLTAGATAHESLRAVLPEMASYLRSEAVSVSRIALHRADAGSSAMGTAEGQQHGGAPRQGAAGEQGQNGGGSSKKTLPETEQRGAGSVGTPTRDAVNLRSAGGVHAMLGLGVGFGITGGSSGGWLNVCA